MTPRRTTARKPGSGVKPPERRGRPSLTGGGISPMINFRVPAQLRERVDEVASREHKTVSALVREALEARVTST